MGLPLHILGSLIGLVILVLAWPIIAAFLVSHGIPADVILQDVVEVMGSIFRIFMKALHMAEARMG